jgi:hypothetical protein
MPVPVRHREHPRHERKGAIYESGRGEKILEGSLSSPLLGGLLTPEMLKGAGIRQPP